MSDKTKTAVQRWCPNCLSKTGVRSQVVPKRLNETLALWKCSSPTCIYPLNLKPELFEAHIEPVNRIDSSYFARSYLPINQLESRDNTNSDSSGGESNRIESSTPPMEPIPVITMEPPVPDKPPSPPPVNNLVESRVKTNNNNNNRSSGSNKIISSTAIPPSESLPAKPPQSSLSASRRLLIQNHLGKRPANDTAKLDSNSGLNTPSDSKKANSLPAKQTAKKPPQQSLLTSPSVAFFPGYVASSSGFTDNGDAKSDGSDGTERGRNSGLSFASYISPKIKQTLRANIAGSKQQLPSALSVATTANPNTGTSFNSNMNTRALVQQQQQQQQQKQKQHSQPPPVSTVAPYDFSDPFASYDFVQTLDSSEYFNHHQQQHPGIVPNDSYFSSSFPLEPSMSSSNSDFDPMNPSYFISDDFHSL